MSFGVAPRPISAGSRGFAGCDSCDPAHSPQDSLGGREDQSRTRMGHRRVFSVATIMPAAVTSMPSGVIRTARLPGSGFAI